MVYLCNAFSLNMLEFYRGRAMVRVARLTRGEARAYLEAALSGNRFASAVGHESTSRVLSSELDLDVPTNRTNLCLRPGDTLVVAQYRGPRLPEGATELPEGSSIEYYLVYLAD